MYKDVQFQLMKVLVNGRFISSVYRKLETIRLCRGYNTSTVTVLHLSNERFKPLWAKFLFILNTFINTPCIYKCVNVQMYHQRNHLMFHMAISSYGKDNVCRLTLIPQWFFNWNLCKLTSVWSVWGVISGANKSLFTWILNRLFRCT